MEKAHRPLVFLFLATLAIVYLKPVSSSPTATPLPPPPPSTPTPRARTLPPLPPLSLSPPPPPLPKQLNNIIDALIGAGDFTSWVNILTMANPVILPLSATLFIPEDNTLDHHPAMDPLLFPYHIVPQRLTFSDLLLFKAKTRLPTLLPGKSIFVTNNSRSNFTLDDTTITHPDLYSTATVAVHGVAAILDYSVFGNGLPLFSTPPTGDPELAVFRPQPPKSPAMPIGETTGRRSDAACSYPKWTIVFLIVLTLEMQRNHLAR